MPVKGKRRVKRVKSKLISSLSSSRGTALAVLVVLIAVLSGCMGEVVLTPRPQGGSGAPLPMSVRIEVTESVAKVNMATPIKFDIKQAMVGYFNNRGVFRDIVETGGEAVLKVQSRFVFSAGKVDFNYSFELQGTLQDGAVLLGNYHAECSAAGGMTRFTSEADRVPMNKALTECLDKLAGQIEAEGPTIMAKLQGVQPAAIAAKADNSSLPRIKSDVDDIPAIKAKPNKNAYAIVIGIENYRQKLPKADFATHDAETMAMYLTRVMGYPEENVVTLINDKASMTDFAKYFEKWLPNNVEENGTVFVYYSGHGAPNTKTGDAFLVPYDGDPAFIDQTGYSLKRLYDSLGKLQAKEIIVALDSCFSGAGGRSVIAKGSRPLVMKMETLSVPSNVAVLSASSGEQTSSSYEEKGHGLFTYFMLKGIKSEGDTNGDGKVEAGELFDYIKPQVERTARKLYNNEQTPQLIAPKENRKMFINEHAK